MNLELIELEPPSRNLNPPDGRLEVLDVSKDRTMGMSELQNIMGTM